MNEFSIAGPTPPLRAPLLALNYAAVPRSCAFSGLGPAPLHAPPLLFTLDVASSRKASRSPPLLALRSHCPFLSQALLAPGLGGPQEVRRRCQECGPTQEGGEGPRCGPGVPRGSALPRAASALWRGVGRARLHRCGTDSGPVRHLDRQTAAAGRASQGRGRSGRRGGAEAPAEACALLRPPPPAAERSLPSGGSRARRRRCAGRERRQGGRAESSRAERNAPATGGRRQDAPARGPLRRQPSSLFPAARARPRDAGATAGAGGWSSEQAPQAPERRVSNAALARGRLGGRTPSKDPSGRTLGGEGLSAVCRSRGLSKGSRAPLRAAQRPQLGDLQGNFPEAGPFLRPPNLQA